MTAPPPETPPARRDDNARLLAGPYRRLTAGIVLAILVMAFEGIGVATAMPVAVRALDGLPLYAWAFSAMLAASLFGMVVSGEVSDRSGPYAPVLASAGFFGGGLVVCGVATTMPVFIAGRALQGLGAGLLIVALYVVVARAYPEHLRPRVFSAMASAWVLPSIIGPVVAGWVADHLSWRLVFLGVLPLLAPALLMILPAVHRHQGPADRDAQPVVRRGRKRLALAAAVGAALVQYAAQHLVATGLAALVAGLLLLGASLPRLLPRGTLRAARGLPTTVAMRGVLAGTFFGAEAFLPLMLVTERGLSTTLAGMSLTGAALGWATGSWYQGRPATRIARPTLVRLGAALVAGAIAVLVLAVWPAAPAWLAAAAWVFGGLGMGLGTASVSVLVLEQSPPPEQGANSAALQLSDALGSMLLIGVSGAIFAALHVGPGQDGTTFRAIFATMAVLAVLGVAVSGRIRADRPPTPPRQAQATTPWSSARRRSESSSPARTVTK